MGCIGCCPAVYLVGLLPWQPAPGWPESLCGLWMRRSAAVYYPGRPDTVQKLYAPAGPSHSRRDPTPPEPRRSRATGQDTLTQTELHTKHSLYCAAALPQCATTCSGFFFNLPLCAKLCCPVCPSHQARHPSPTGSGHSQCDLPEQRASEGS